MTTSWIVRTGSMLKKSDASVSSWEGPLEGLWRPCRSRARPSASLRAEAPPPRRVAPAARHPVDRRRRRRGTGQRQRMIHPGSPERCSSRTRPRRRGRHSRLSGKHRPPYQPASRSRQTHCFPPFYSVRRAASELLSFAFRHQGDVAASGGRQQIDGSIETTEHRARSGTTRWRPRPATGSAIWTLSRWPGRARAASGSMLGIAIDDPWMSAPAAPLGTMRAS